MATLEKGITPTGEGYRGKTWNILGQIYFPKAVTDPPSPSKPIAIPGNSCRCMCIRPRTSSSWSRKACST